MTVSASFGTAFSVADAALGEARTAIAPNGTSWATESGVDGSVGEHIPGPVRQL